MSSLIRTDQNTDQALSNGSTIRCTAKAGGVEMKCAYSFCHCYKLKTNRVFKHDKLNFYGEYDEVYTAPVNCHRCGKMFKVVSSLNGSNGSFTNTDDHDAADRVRAKKEAKNHLHKKTGTSGNVSYGVPLPAQCAARRVAAKPDEELPIVDDIWYVYSHLHPYVFDECGLVYKRSSQLLEFTSLCGKVINSHLISEGTRATGVMRDGVLYRGEGVLNIIATHDLRKGFFKSSKQGDVYLDGFNGWYYSPLFKEYQGALPLNGKPTLQRKCIAMGTAQKKFPNLDDQIIFWTVEYFDVHQRFMATRLITNHDTALIYNTPELTNGVYDKETLRAGRGIHTNVQFVQQYTMPALQCQLASDWVKKNTYTVSGRGCVIDLPDDGVCNIEFNTKWDVTSLSKYNKTVMCSFSGKGAQFIHYEVSGENACLAAKRLCAARVDEIALYSNQLSVLSSLQDASLISQPILDQLLVHRKHNPNWGPYYKIGSNKKGENHSTPYIPAQHSTIVYGVKKLLSRVNRPYISALMDDVNNTTHWAYYNGWQSCLELQDAWFGRSACAQIRHIKAKLRQQYVQGVLLHDDADLMVRRLNGCIKKEWAKPGKVPRLFVSYGAGSMYANDIPENIKQCLQEPYQFRKGELWDHGTVEVFIMSKPKNDSMALAFNELIKATSIRDHIFICIYSDDSVYSGNIDGVPFGFNVDISSCDASNNSLVFALAGTMLANFNLDRAKGLIAQCMLPVRVDNPVNKDEYFVVKYHSAFEGSGTVLTTILNHSASFLIAMSVIQKLNSGHSIENSIVDGAGNTGHLVTLDSWCLECIPTFEKIQFLKHSPIMSTCGKWIPTINYGCIFRSLGTLDGDMTSKQLNSSDAEFKKMSWAARMDNFCSGVVRGLKHEPKSSILESLRERFQSGTADIVLDSAVRTIMSTDGNSDDLVYGQLRSSYNLDEDSLCRRYDIVSDDLEELSLHIRNIQLGEDSITDAVSQFYKLDYGL